VPIFNVTQATPASILPPPQPGQFYPWHGPFKLNVSMIFSKIEHVQHAEIHFSRRGNANDTKIITVPIFD